MAKVTSTLEAIKNSRFTIILLTSSKNDKNENMTVSSTLKTLKENFSKLGFNCHIVKADIATLIEKDGKFLLKGERNITLKISPYNTICLTRRGAIFTKSGISLLSQLETNKFKVYNSKDSMLTCEDKYASYLKFEGSKVSTPKTVLVNNDREVESGIKIFKNKFPLICKLVASTQGVGVFKVDSEDSLKSTLQTIWKLSSDEPILIQEMIENSEEYRVHVLDGKVIGAISKTAVKGFRANVHLGSVVNKVTPDKALTELSIKSADSVGGFWTGVDIIKEKGTDKLYTLEVNTSPGIDGIMSAGVDIVSELMSYFKANFSNLLPSNMETSSIEMFKIGDFGEFESLLDTGNRTSSASLHVDDLKPSDDEKTVTFKVNSKSHSLPVSKITKVKSNVSSDEKATERFTVLLDISFKGKTVKDYPVNLSDRSHKKFKFLVNSDLMSKLGIVVSPD